MPLGFLNLDPSELIIFGVIAVLLFGERLPEVGRKVGKQIGDLQRSLRSLQDEFTAAANVDVPRVEGTRKAAVRREPTVEEESTAPKFVPPPMRDQEPISS